MSVLADAYRKDGQLRLSLETSQEILVCVSKSEFPTIWATEQRAVARLYFHRELEMNLQDALGHAKAALS
eukprot:4790573-Prymnesium_polylepis.1